MERAHIPGCAVAIVKEGTVTAQGFGYADLDRRTPTTTDSLFPLASLTKSFTALAVMQLVQARRLELDRSVVDYIPGFRVADETAGPRMTVRMLLCHLSGLGRTTHLDTNMGAIYASRADLVERLQTAVPQSAPGEAWSYSNEAYSTAGHLVDLFGGLPYEEYLTQRVLAPLGMKASTTDITAWKQSPHRARGYALNAEGRATPVPDLPISPASLPAGRLCSTAPDLARYLGAMMAYGSNPLLAQEQHKAMHTPSAVWGDTGWGYGLGWFIKSGPGGKVVHHGGNLPGVATHLFMLPAAKLGVVVLTNLTGTPAAHIAEELANLALGAPVLRASVRDPLPITTAYSPAPAWLSDGEGSFSAPLADMSIAVTDGQLRITQHLRLTGAVVQMETLPIGDDLLMLVRGGSEGQPMRLLRNAEGAVDRLLLAGTLYRRS
jgi:CubicO group peptidase (beta-lactamase class C family)